MNHDSSSARIAEKLRREISSMPEGSRLSSTRALVASEGVGPVTIQSAIATLVAEGLVVTRPGAGTFVARRVATTDADADWQHVALGASPVEPSGTDVLLQASHADRIPMVGGFPDEPLRADRRLAAAIARAGRRQGAWGLPPPPGIPGLRAWFARELGVRQDDVLITPGGQGAISATMRALVRAGSPVLFAVPTYPGALAVARSAGLVPIPVPGDEDGVRPDLLADAFATTRSRLLYLQPTFANPDGHVLATERRGEVLEIAARAGAFVLEDDWARWLGHGRPVPPPLLRDDVHGHVITVNSLTKAAAPSLRIGALVARGPVAGRLAAMRFVDDFFVSGPLQEAALELVSSTAWPAHLRQLGANLRQRLELLEAALAKRLPGCARSTPRGGLHVWLTLPRGVEDRLVVERAAALGVSVAPGRLFTLGEQDRHHLRLSYAALGADLVAPAVARLAQAIEDAASAA